MNNKNEKHINGGENKNKRERKKNCGIYHKNEDMRFVYELYI